MFKFYRIVVVLGLIFMLAGCIGVVPSAPRMHKPRVFKPVPKVYAPRVYAPRHRPSNYRLRGQRF